MAFLQQSSLEAWLKVLGSIVAEIEQQKDLYSGAQLS
jgi:hypothetical protein